MMNMIIVLCLRRGGSYVSLGGEKEGDQGQLLWRVHKAEFWIINGKTRERRGFQGEGAAGGGVQNHDL